MGKRETEKHRNREIEKETAEKHRKRVNETGIHWQREKETEIYRDRVMTERKRDRELLRQA
jgi:hypothetical protein